ncbi:MAG: hydrogenase formation protein HypD [Candidatus Omnitrophica bacterium]|nr:hydrogenase formation protein HypD [Candidatus Omnitrophota bacterium]
MKYIDEFRDSSLVHRLADRIRAAASHGREYKFMEVCGTHTMAVFRFGLRDLLEPNIKLISGPGCPVCVTPVEYMDRTIAIARLPDVIITTFGDMMRVPGSRSSLYKEKAAGRDVRMVYSTDDALDIAKRNPGKEVVFLGVGFETTVPTVGASIITAARQGIGNYSVLCAHKTMPEALRWLVADSRHGIDGFLLPGHVSAITGMKPYEFLAKEYNTGCVAAGFEPVDILQAILMLVNQSKPRVEIQYKRIITPLGNRLARSMTGMVFEKCSSVWRGIGEVKDSGLKIRREFSGFDAALKFKVKVTPAHENKVCICNMVLKGVKTPLECRLFGKRCTPDNPVGSCMVSSEGTCAAYYKYGRR